jgi:hypothetical protein
MATQQIDMTPDESVFNEQEVAALEVGERMHQEQQQLLAGKFQDAEALEQAYIELQRKLGSGNESESPNDIGDENNETEEQEEEVELDEVSQLIVEASAVFTETGEITPELMEQFNGMSSQELVNAYINMQSSIPQEGGESEDLSESDINVIKNEVGGEEGYNQLMEWAGDNLNEIYIDAFNELTNSGSAAAIQLAVSGLRAQYEMNYGQEGRMLSGKDAQSSTSDVFRSQAEVVAAMQDQRYDRDPAYRNDVFQKLERSNVEF